MKGLPITWRHDRAASEQSVYTLRAAIQKAKGNKILAVPIGSYDPIEKAMEWKIICQKAANLSTAGAVGKEKVVLEKERSLAILQVHLFEEMIKKLESKKLELFSKV